MKNLPKTCTVAKWNLSQEYKVNLTFKRTYQYTSHMNWKKKEKCMNISNILTLISRNYTTEIFSCTHNSKKINFIISNRCSINVSDNVLSIE